MVNKWTRATAPVPALRGGLSSGGREPNLNPDFADWARMPKWNGNEAAALLRAMNPDYALRTRSHCGTSRLRLPHDQQAKYEWLRKLVNRAFPEPYYDDTPARWLAWAKKLDLTIPPGLAEAVAKYDQTAAQAVAENKEIDELILAADALKSYQVGVAQLYKIAHEKGLYCTKGRIANRAKSIVRTAPKSKGRPKKCPKKLSQKTIPKN